MLLIATSGYIAKAEAVGTLQRRKICDGMLQS
jgi:hypothetical protein